MKTLKVREVMTEKPVIASTTQTVREAAKMMKTIGCGVLPVGNIYQIQGMLTDRDIVLRVVAEGKDPAKVTIGDVMTEKVVVCDENEDLDAVAEAMCEHNVARIMVTRKGKPAGIISQADLLRAACRSKAGNQVLRELVGEKGSRKSKDACCA